MTDKVQKIREEVEKLHGNPYYMMAIKDVLEILDMQGELVSMWHDIIEEPKPNMELICVGQYGNPLVLSSNSDSFNERYISKWAYFNDLLNLSNVERIVKDWKEPVSEDLETEIDNIREKYYGLESLCEHDVIEICEHFFKFGAAWQKEKEYSCYEEAFEDGAKWKVENLWKPADGDDLPKIDREVIALLDNGKVVFAHRPNPEGWDAVSIITEKVEHYTPKTYDKGGWNIPDVKWWLDCLMPNMED